MQFATIFPLNMKVKDLITPTIIKRINWILFPLLALIFIIAGALIYRIRSEQAIRLGKLQARITSLNMLEFVKNEMLNYINVCVSYSNMVEMYNEVEPGQQASYLSQLTQHVLQTNKNVLALRCNAHEIGRSLADSTREHKIEIAQSSASKEIANDIEHQFYKLGLLNRASLAKTNHVSITNPYQVPTADTTGQNKTYNILTFYKAVKDGHNNIIGQACVDVQAAKIAQLLQELQALAKKQNCQVSLYLNDVNKFISTAKGQTIDLNSQPSDMSEELITIINDGYDAEYDDTEGAQYFFIIPARLPNFNSELTIIASFSHSELTKSIGGFAAKLLTTMIIAYILIIALLLYVNKYLYKKFIEADIIMLSSQDEDIQIGDIYDAI